MNVAHRFPAALSEGRLICNSLGVCFREGGGIKGSNHGLAAFGEGSLAAVSISSFAVKWLLVPPV